MGVILSAVAVATSSIKKSRDRKKAKKTRSVSGTTQPPPYSHSQDGAVNAGSIPGVAATQVEGQVERNVAVPISTTSESIPLPSIPTNRETEIGSVKKGEMASDEDYASFLDKANEDPSAGVAKSAGKGKIQLKAVDVGVEVPAGLKKVTEDAFYVSDADEPFEPVCLKHGGKSLPTEAAFAKLVNHPSPKDADVSIMDIGEWDPQGQYKELVDAVRKETKGSDVMVYRIARDGTRVEYFLVGLEGGKLVGVKALAVES